VKEESLVFDFDGVFVDSNELKGETLVRALGAVGAGYEQAILEYHRANPQLSILEKIRKFKFLEDSRSEMEIEKSFRDEILASREIELLDDADWVIEELAQMYTLHICSAAPEAEIRAILSRSRIDPMFQSIEGNVGNKGSHLQRLKNHLIEDGRRLKFYIGDSPTDRTAAMVARVPFIAFRMNNSSDVTNIRSWRGLNEYIQKKAHRFSDS
jgi:phosphoglycolate phosphatase-like HAD superfamily hydrolase